MNRRKFTAFNIVITMLILMGLVLSSTTSVLAASNDDNVEWLGAGHLPGSDICGDVNFPYRSPENPRADQSVTLRARIYWQDLTGLTFWYTTNPLATTQSDWTSVAASWEANWGGCGGLGDMDIYSGSIPAQTSTVWYKIAYTDGTDTDWQRGPGEGGTEMYDDDGGWATGSTTLTYAPPATVYVDDDFDATTPGWGYDYFDTIPAGVSAVATSGMVNVAAGNYSTGATLNRSVTIQGAGTSSTVVQGADAGQGFSIANGTEDVTFTDLTVRNFQDGFVLGTATGAITNVVLTDVETITNTRHGIFSNAAQLTDITLTRVNASWNGTVTTWSRGLFFQASGGARNNVTIEDGTFSNNRLVGIDFNIGQATDITITGNTVENNGDAGIGLLGAFSALIDNNTVTDNGRFGIEIKNPNGDGTLSGPNRFVISNNNVSLTGAPSDARDLAGIAVFRRDVVLTDGNPDIPSGVIVTGNTVSGYQQTTNDGFGIVVEGTEMRVYNNTLNNNEIGVQQQAGNDGYPGNSEQTLTNDYFSRGNSPTTCADIGTNTYSGNTIDYRAVGTLGTPDVLNTDTNVNFCSIQSAIDDSATLDTHTIQVSAGVYTENVNIDKGVTLAGAGQANTTIIPALSNPDCRFGGGGSMCVGGTPEASNLLNVEASDVTIHDLTIDGDNPALTSGVIRNGADLDARNGIITYYSAGVLNNLEVYNVTALNIYLRGIYPSSGGTFNIHDNYVDNVRGEAASAAFMNWAGSGTFANNTVNNSNDGLVSNHSSGTSYLNNTVTNSASGVHTDNNGDNGGTADILQGNNVSDCDPDGYGVWVFASRLNTVVDQNTITNCAVGLAAAGQYGGIPSFTNNNVDGQALSGSAGVYVTTSLFGWGSSDVNVSFSNNTIQNADQGFFLESEAGNALDASIADNTITTVSSGIAITSTGTATIVAKGNGIDGATTVFSGSLNTNYTLNAYANNITNFGDGGLTSATGTFNARRNWWGSYATQPTGVDSDSWDYRLGADVHTWADGVDSAALGSATMSGGTGAAVIIGHGRGLANAPFGNGVEPYVSNLCSEFYDYFVVNGSGTWQVQVPVDGGADCDAVRTNNGLAYIQVGTHDLNCDTPTNSACWELAPNVSNSGTHLISSGLSATDLGGTQFVAGAPDAPNDPTVVQLHSLSADGATSLALPIALAFLLLAGGSLLILQRKRT